MPSTAGQPTPLRDSPYPLAFVATKGSGTTRADGVAYRSEVMGLGGFQKEGLVEDIATGRSWRLVCDEGGYLGGADMAPAPLAHWAAGLHGDITARIAQTAQDEGIAVGALSVTLVQGFGAQGSFARGEAVALVFGLSCHVAIETAADEDVVSSLVARALETSPAYIAMTTPHEGRFALYANGRSTPVIGVPQSTALPETDPFLRHAGRPAPAEHGPDSASLLTRRVLDAGWSIQLTDDQDDTVQWRIQATGSYDFATGLVASEIGVPTGEAGSSTWTLISDANNLHAPDPLAYFSIGTAFCYHTQLCRYVKVRRMPVDAPRLAQISHFTTAERTARVEPFDTHLFIDGTADEQQTISLLSSAANTCYVHRGLTLPVETKVSITMQRDA
ncbi:MAG TPA: hypothetical protein VHY31_26630 [Streptosporangiaceae bacterium]|nr:hypothetical protein [Streptosporangiaceae bacterium]